jgi:hypothetical protein
VPPLERVGELVSEQSLAGVRAWVKPIGAEHDVVASLVSPRVERGRWFPRGSVGVHSHPTEVLTHSVLDRSPEARVQSLAGSAPHFMHHGRSEGRSGRAVRVTLEGCLPFLLACFALAAASVLAAVARAL